MPAWDPTLVVPMYPGCNHHCEFTPLQPVCVARHSSSKGESATLGW